MTGRIGAGGAYGAVTCAHGIPYGSYCWQCNPVQWHTATANQGWQCPSCLRTWSPLVTSCGNCPPGEVHVDWRMTADEWESFRAALRKHLDVPFIADLEAAGKLGGSVPTTGAAA